MTMSVKGLIVNHTTPDLRARLHPKGGKQPGLFHRNVKNPVYFRGFDVAQFLKR
jgi:hypothetical protein